MRRKPSPSSATGSYISESISLNDTSNGYQTPETSAVATPAEISAKGKRSTVPSKNLTLTQRGKRKRSIESTVDPLDDAALAEKLQHEEYMRHSITNGKNKRYHIADTDDESSDLHLSDTSVLTISDSDSAESFSLPKPKKAKLSKSRSRPMSKRSISRPLKTPKSNSRLDSEVPLSDSFSGAQSDFESVTPDFSDGNGSVGAQADDPLTTIQQMRGDGGGGRRRGYGNNRASTTHLISYGS